MSFIGYIKESDASETLKTLYDKYRSPHGDVDHILKIHSYNPRSMVGHYEYYKTLMFGRSELTRVQREMIAVVVSAENRCTY